MSHLVKILWARAKDLDGKEVFGWAKFYNYMDRKFIYRLYNKKDNKEATFVDPLSVEFYIGIDDALTGEKIYEGDVIRLQEDDMLVNAFAKSREEDALCEVRCPFDPVKQKKYYLYAHNVEGVQDLMLSNDFRSKADVFRNLRWVKVGNVNDKEFGLPSDDQKVQLNQSPLLAERMFANAEDPNKLVWTVHLGNHKYFEKMRFLGTYLHRMAIAESMIQWGFFLFLIDIHPELKKLLKKWEIVFGDYWDSPDFTRF